MIGPRRSSSAGGDDGDASGRLRVGEEAPPCESPCPGCGAYYFALHEDGCEYEQCARCGGPRISCDCDRRD
jgi:hypothetical protein